MITETNIILKPEYAANTQFIKKEIADELGIATSRIVDFRINRRTVDARQRNIKISLGVSVGIDELLPKEEDESDMFSYNDVSNARSVIVVGAGPAGLFAALRLIELGIKPIVVERGKKVDQRKNDLSIISSGVWTPDNDESNFCFGEGGAGAFSDGKLYTRSSKRGNGNRILHIFHLHGAQDNILTDAHPHIGTDILPSVIKNIRKRIENCGGQFLFETKMTSIVIKDGSVKGINVTGKHEGCIESNAVILATGHSARDVYAYLNANTNALQCKGFAMGIRVEHPQTLIDSIQYHNPQGRGNYLPAANYNLVTQTDFENERRGVYSFCMCPGGEIVSAVSHLGEIVVNGMSNSKRDSAFANSGIVVEIRPEDLHDNDALAGMRMQQELERLAKINNGGGALTAPAQRLNDFVKGKLSPTLPKCSYQPGTISSPLHFWLPKMISKRLQDGFLSFDKKMHGFLTNEAIIVGVESRSSSPVRILRDKESLECPEIKGLFPCGEGAGYAGGITSSAIDGERCAEKAALIH
ncbi:MAG: FAD-binding protein [Paludibacteraceae bacterium]|nr:FAD-binding protein [Paludibacteraceae bacterium]